MKVEKLSFEFWEHLDALDSERESQLLRIGRTALPCCLLQLIEIPRSIEIFE
jgi:hypothetical protein